MLMDDTFTLGGKFVPQPMIYKYKTWTLYRKDVRPLFGEAEKVYFFAKRKTKGAEPSDLPSDYEVHVDSKSDLPVLVKRASKVLSATTASTFFQEMQPILYQWDKSSR